MSSRKIQTSARKEGQRRRSPRISALDACKQNHQDQRQPSRIKRKFDNVAATFTSSSKLAKQVWKGRDSPQNARPSTDHAVLDWRSARESQMVKQNQNHDDHATTSGKASIMPPKHVLELVLDTLQRRDTYEVFAEPVDPDEVEDYYEIVKEPMDFGTMRAKLHEGMYENLKQFEHDVFLIPENAMQFNSSTTIYFRQARAIHELAKKVFHALKTDPENFVLEFSGTRRRSMRKALSETKDSRLVSTIPRAGTAGNDASSKEALHSSSTSTFRRTTKKNPGKADHFCSRNFFSGSKDGRLSSSDAADKRSTYCAWKSSLCNDKGSVDSTFYNNSKTLVLMNHGDISYKDSLMSYIKDLGPIAQNVAKRKLLEHHESNGRVLSDNSAATQRKSVSSDANTFRTFRDFAPGCCPFLKASNIIDLTQDTEEANGSKNGRKDKADCGTTPAGKEKTDCGTTPADKEKTNSHSPVTLTNRGGLVNGHTVGKRRGTTRNPVGRDSNCSTGRSNNISYRDDNVRPVILALENYHSNATEFKSRNKKNCIEPTAAVPWRRAKPALGSCGEATAAISSSSLTQQRAQPLPLNSQFTFDLPFLKAQLSQMNALGIGGELLKKRAPFEKGGVINCTRQAESIGMKPPFLYSKSRTSPSFDKLDTNLALQL